METRGCPIRRKNSTSRHRSWWGERDEADNKSTSTAADSDDEVDNNESTSAADSTDDEVDNGELEDTSEPSTSASGAVSFFRPPPKSAAELAEEAECRQGIFDFVNKMGWDKY